MSVKGFRNLVALEADANGNAPATIELLRVGDWHTPWHGDFEITADDLTRFVSNFEAGVGLVEADKQAPINFGHFGSGEAAGWITRVEATEDGQVLTGHVEWTEDAAQAIKAKKWKYISPEFNPRAWPWEDPEEEFHFVNNVITAAALTNIPLFKRLKPITASRLAPKEQGVKADTSNQEGDHMTLVLDEVRVKEVTDLTDEEKTFLEESKAELTAEELTKFGIEADAEGDEEEEEEEEKPAAGGAPIDASAINAVTPEELAQLRADAKAGQEARQILAEREARDFVKTHIAAGRVKSDQLDNTVKMLLASKGSERNGLEAFIAGLPENKLLASEQGDAGKGAAEPTISDEEKALAESFGNTPEEIEEYKKSQAEAGK